MPTYYIPLGTPKTWAVQVDITVLADPMLDSFYGFTYLPHWSALVYDTYYSGTASGTISLSRSLQDMLKITTSGTGVNEAVQSVRHVRAFADAAGYPGTITEVPYVFYRTQVSGGWQLTTSDDTHPRLVIPSTNASVSVYTAGGASPERVNGPGPFGYPSPADVIINPANYDGTSPLLPLEGFPLNQHSGAKLVDFYPKTKVQVTCKAVWWPTTDPVVGLPITLWGNGRPSFDDGSGPSATFICKKALTDGNGEYTYNTGDAPIDGWNDTGINSNFKWTGTFLTGAFAVDPNQSWLRTRSVDAGALHSLPSPYGTIINSGTAYAASTPPSPAKDGFFELYRYPDIVTATRRTSRIFSDGQDAASWYGKAYGTYYPNGDTAEFEVTSETPKIHVSQETGGVRATVDSNASIGFFNTPTIEQAISDAGQRQSLANRRWMKVTINSSVAGAHWVTVFSTRQFANSIHQPVRARVDWPVNLAVGDNVFWVDLLGVNTRPWGTSGAWDDATNLHTRARGYILDDDPTLTPNYNTWNSIFPSLTQGPGDSGTNTRAVNWPLNRPDRVRIANLKPGGSYLIKEIALVDRADGARTPLRVGGEVDEWGNPFDFNPGAYPASQPYQIRVMINGMPVIMKQPIEFDGGNYFNQSVDTLITRLGQYYSPGIDDWTFASNDAVTAKLPHFMCMPNKASASPTGFTMDGVAWSQSLNMQPCFDLTVASSITCNMGFGGNVDGILLEYQSRTPRPGKTVNAYLKESSSDGIAPEPDPALVATAVSDDDGYFAFKGLVSAVEFLSTFNLQTKYGHTYYVTPYQFWASDDPPDATVPASESSGGQTAGHSLSANFWTATIGHRITVPYVDLAKFLASGLSPSNEHDRFGPYYRVNLSTAGNVLVRRADSAIPGMWAIIDKSPAPLTGATAENPRLLVDARGKLHVYAGFTGVSITAGIYRSHSWDDGATWSEWAMAISGGKHPAVGIGLDGTKIVAAYVSGHIQATVQAPGDAAPSSPVTFTDQTGAALSVADDCFGLSAGYALSAPWVLAVTIQGETSVSDWVAHSESHLSFKRVS